MDTEGNLVPSGFVPPKIHVLHPGVDGGGGRNVRTGQYGIAAIHFGDDMNIDGHYARRITDRNDALTATARASQWAADRDGNGFTVVYYVGFARYNAPQLSYDVRSWGSVTIHEAYSNAQFADDVLRLIGDMPEFFPGRGAK